MIYNLKVYIEKRKFFVLGCVEMWIGLDIVEKWIINEIK